MALLPPATFARLTRDLAYPVNADTD
jgi:hypothetical protein